MKIRRKADVSPVPPTAQQFIDSLKATYPDDFYGEAQDFKEEVLAILETLSAPPVAPSVGELEWRAKDDVTYSDKGGADSLQRWETTGWLIAESYRHRGWQLWPDLDDIPMAECDTLEEAKSLANSLQRILSGAAE
jgi:hypothetical protein